MTTAEPVTYTHPDVFTLGVTEGWAEDVTDPAAVDWPSRLARSAIPYEIVNGRPVNPCATTAVRYGRNEMGFWGENLMADALVTLTYRGSLYLLMIERGDGHGWAVPGGHVEPGETGLKAALRELEEETGLAVPGLSGAAMLEPRYVPDPRSSDEAWAVTVPVHVRLPDDVMPAVRGGDDARNAHWIAAPSLNALERNCGSRVFAAHVPMLREFLEEQR